MYIYITGTRMDVIPARQLARMSMALAGRYGEGACDDRAAPFERRAQALELLRLEVELDPQVFDVRRACGGQMVEEAVPLGIRRAHPLDLCTSDRIEQPRDLVGDEQVLAAVHGDDDVTTFREVAEPRPLRPGPVSESAAAGLVGLLVARPVETRQRGVSRARQQAPVA